MQQYYFVKSFLFKHKLVFYLLLPFILAACASADESVQSDVTEPPSSEEAEALEEEVSDNVIVDRDETETVQVPNFSPAENAGVERSTAEDAAAEAFANAASPGMEPAQLLIPAIGVDASIDGYGLDADGKMEVPDEGESIAWYERGAKPGAQGNSVLAGHVDDQSGPAVFYDLKELEQGDEITVVDEAGASLTFQVTHMESYPYDDAPLSVVFGSSSSRNLNLITCTGEFDRDAGTHRERLVVFTELVEETV